MIRDEVQDSHTLWLQDMEYRKEFGSESAKLEFAAALADARETARLTQSMLAERAGVSQAYIAKLERGDANPTIGNIGRLLACMWLKPSIQVVPMESHEVIQSSYTESQSTPQPDVVYSEVRWAISVGQESQVQFTPVRA